MEANLPRFCWQTVQEIQTMLEQIDEDIELFLVTMTLRNLYKLGMVEKRLIKTGRRPGHIPDNKPRPSGPLAVYEYKMAERL